MLEFFLLHKLRWGQVLNHTWFQQDAVTKCYIAVQMLAVLKGVFGEHLISHGTAYA